VGGFASLPQGRRALRAPAACGPGAVAGARVAGARVAGARVGCCRVAGAPAGPAEAQAATAPGTRAAAASTAASLVRTGQPPDTSAAQAPPRHRVLARKPQTVLFPAWATDGKAPAQPLPEVRQACPRGDLDEAMRDQDQAIGSASTP
jgi:hypothetical protein